MKIYTKTGDDGSTGLLYGGRVPKDSVHIELNGAVDEAQAAIGMARAFVTRGSDLDDVLIQLETDLWVLMAEVATLVGSRGKLTPGKSMITSEMVGGLEELIDSIQAKFAMPKAFVVPGANPITAGLDVARTVIRRAERLSLPFCREAPGTQVGVYLNRLSDLAWTLARWQEGEHLLAKEVERKILGKVSD